MTALAHNYGDAAAMANELIDWVNYGGYHDSSSGVGNRYGWDASPPSGPRS